MAEPGRERRRTQTQWKARYDRLKNKFADWDLYQQVFDPTKDKELIFGSLADDVADIYFDLAEGLAVIQADKQAFTHAMWNWRLFFYSHWGKHALDALGVIHIHMADMEF